LFDLHEKIAGYVQLGEVGVKQTEEEAAPFLDHHTALDSISTYGNENVRVDLVTALAQHVLQGLLQNLS